MRATALSIVMTYLGTAFAAAGPVPARGGGGIACQSGSIQI
jgi:hypothetical protein